MRRTSALKILCCLFGCWLGTACVGTGQARADVIYQAFDEHFRNLEGKLDHLASLGYSYIQVSPPEKSANDTIWWARYQPLDLNVIDGPLGNEADLRHLIASAHQRGLKVLVDVVLNHMADPSYNGGTLQYPQFSARDFHYPDQQPCIADYENRYEVTHYWLCDPNLGHRLPDLDSSSAYVRGVHKKYLKKLLDLGADGFRFDAAKHIDPDYFGDILGALPPAEPHGYFYYGEVIGGSLAESQEYTPMMAVTDFQLLGTMLGAFSVNGDLRSLIDPGAVGAALPGDVAVVFARNHDTAMHSDFFNFGDYQDALLATAFAVGRGVGTGFVYRDDADQPVVVNAVRFHNAMADQYAYVRRADEVCGGACDPRTLLFVERGGVGLMILNSANVSVDAPAAQMPGLEAGCYIELANNFKVQVAAGGDGQMWVSRWGSPTRGGLKIGPRTALYLVQTDAAECR